MQQTRSKSSTLSLFLLPFSECFSVLLSAGIEPFECYEGALYAFYDESSFSKTKFKDDAALKPPEGAPLVQEKIDEKNNVKITWTELPRSQRKGCITKYTIYIETKGHERFCKDDLNCTKNITFIFCDKSKKVFIFILPLCCAPCRGFGFKPCGHQYRHYCFIQ